VQTTPALTHCCPSLSPLCQVSTSKWCNFTLAKTTESQEKHSHVTQ